MTPEPYQKEMQFCESLFRLHQLAGELITPAVHHAVEIHARTEA
jgi:hypothetical protein